MINYLDDRDVYIDDDQIDDDDDDCDENGDDHDDDCDDTDDHWYPPGEENLKKDSASREKTLCILCFGFCISISIYFL